MIQAIAPKSDINVKSNVSEIHEYSITLVNWEEKKVEIHVAAFASCPSPEDWKNRLYGWNSLGYELAGEPLRVRTF